MSNTETFSDHNQIEFIVLSEDKNKPTKRTFKNIRNMNEQNWETFKINIENNLHLLWEAENQDIHKKAEALTKLFTRAQLTTIPKATIAKKKHKQWWSKELTEMKKEMEKLRRIKRNNEIEAMKEQTTRDKLEHRKIQKEFSKLIAKNKKQGWKNFVSEFKQLHQIDKIKLFLKPKNKNIPQTLKKQQKIINKWAKISIRKKTIHNWTRRNT